MVGRTRKRQKVQTQANKITNYFGIHLGLEMVHLGMEGGVQKLMDENLSLSVKPYRPCDKPVFEKGFSNKSETS